MRAECKHGALRRQCPICELEAERDRYRDVLLSRHGGEPLALLEELDEARRERDALKATIEEAYDWCAHKEDTQMTEEVLRAALEEDDD